MTYILFGAYKVQVTEAGLECDGWLPIVGNSKGLNDIQTLKSLMENTMLRVYEGILQQRRSPRAITQSASAGIPQPGPLSHEEVAELDLFTRDTVRILNRYSEERRQFSDQRSRQSEPLSFVTQRPSATGKASPFPTWSSSRHSSHGRRH